MAYNRAPSVMPLDTEKTTALVDPDQLPTGSFHGQTICNDRPGMGDGGRSNGPRAWVANESVVDPDSGGG